LPQLQTSLGLRFHAVDDERILYYSRNRPGTRGIVLIAVMLDPAGYAEVALNLPLAEYGFADDSIVSVSEPLSGAAYSVGNAEIQARLSPENPMAVFVVG
jgi:starch synthase (maltosyl-transferring)